MFVLKLMIVSCFVLSSSVIMLVALPGFFTSPLPEPRLSLPTPPTTPCPKLSDTLPFPVCVCSRIFIPICASDGRTYDNMCHFECIRDHLEKTAGKTLYVVLTGEECPEPDDPKKQPEKALTNFIPTNVNVN